MLIANYSYINQICGHNHSGITNPVWIIAPHRMRGYYGSAQTETYSEQIKRDSFPTGTNPPYTIMFGDKGALLSSTTTANGTGTVVTNLSMGKACEAALVGSGTITDANLSLIVQLAAELSGSGTITTAALVGVVALQSSLTGTGSLTAGLSLIAFMNAGLDGNGTLTAELRGTLSLAASIYVNQSEATVQQIVDGVWNAIAADYNTAGTMGNKLNSAGSAGDPWSTNLPGTYTADQAGYLLLAYLKKIKAISSANL